MVQENDGEVLQGELLDLKPALLLCSLFARGRLLDLFRRERRLPQIANNGTRLKTKNPALRELPQIEK